MAHMPTEVLKRSPGAMILIYIILTRFKFFPTLKISTTGLIVGSA